MTRPISRSPSLAELIELAMEKRLEDVHTCLPARVERYDPVQGVVDATPLLKLQVDTDADGKPVFESMPVIPSIPVCFPGAGGFRVTLPIQVGDTVLLVFSERALDNWIDQGNEAEADDSRRHHLTDAFAIPGIRATSKAWKGASTSCMTIGADDPTGPRIGIDATGIVLDGGSQPVARQGDSVQVTIPSGVVQVSGPGGSSSNASPIVVTGTITSGALRVKA